MSVTWVFTIALGLLQASGNIGSAQANVSSEWEERAQCCRQLLLIGDALEEYRRRHSELPPKLADLRGRTLKDPGILQCPVGRRTGETSADPIGSSGTDAETSYHYDFRLDEFPESRGSTWRDFKELQMKIVGGEVPVVRCLQHGEVKLNLAHQGFVYESGLYWEESYRDLVERAQLEEDYLFSSEHQPGQALRTISIPRQSDRIGDWSVDLTACFNVSLPTEIGFPQAGLVTLAEREFDLRGFVQLSSRQRLVGAFPRRVSQLAISGAYAKLHFLHACRYDAPFSEPIGKYRIHFKDETFIDQAIVYGRHVTNWRAPASTRFEPDEHTQRLAAAPLGSDAASRYLFITTWANPNPDLALTRLEYVSEGNAAAAPFLVAISTEK